MCPGYSEGDSEGFLVLPLCEDLSGLRHFAGYPEQRLWDWPHAAV